ncbi:RWD domain-containing protein 2B [Seminavis robusta]|uniref:RWD domain-containing protein 2B n=1 Tax=Seminavis robusta TaxID=568900 RepID=A0A9N8HUL2_9STRA|nr:RWD domain-containing protein 2B [Seminavis robusta]|eukprot:Sro2107_g314860.1 RWD domain-containing protein 2B (299) ;mRNA; f:8878-9774
MEDCDHWLDSLERAVQEMEALQAIYPCDQNEEDEPHSVVLTLKSLDALTQAREILASTTSGDDPLGKEAIPTLEVELQIAGGAKGPSARVYFGLGPGYPSLEPVRVSVLTTEGLANRSAKEDLARQLKEKAKGLVGSEAILELVQECQEELCQLHEQTLQQHEEKNINSDDNNSDHTLGRRWIWVHHITDRQRKLDIVSEARDHGLGGYLKAGYPGIVVVEGPRRACNNFVTWIKGNKSRPGGFGRQWGHHVRGELQIDKLILPASFEVLDEDMSALSSICRNHDLEDEFLKFVMQHG